MTAPYMVPQWFLAKKEKESIRINVWELSWYSSMGYEIWQMAPTEELLMNPNEPYKKKIKVYGNTIRAKITPDNTEVTNDNTSN